ncbi:MAG: substrate-binding domain-containing protein [Proteobacteria bacterium]|nr:substrate-binding domain-containing protein [Pseudomonadota bacterium]
MKNVLFILCFIMISTTASYGDVMVIANKSVPDNVLSHQDVKDIYLGKRLYWSDKSKISFATLSKGDTNTDFLSQFLNKSPKQYASYLEKKVFTTPGQSPKSFASSKKMVEFISSTKGAIGYIDSKTTSDDVKFLVIE